MESQGNSKSVRGNIQCKSSEKGAGEDVLRHEKCQIEQSRVIRRDERRQK